MQTIRNGILILQVSGM